MCAHELAVSCTRGLHMLAATSIHKTHMETLTSHASAGGEQVRGSALAADADGLAAFRVKWTLKLAKAVAAAFAGGAAAYMRRTALEDFALDADDWCGAVLWMTGLLSLAGHG